MSCAACSEFPVCEPFLDSIAEVGRDVILVSQLMEEEGMVDAVVGLAKIKQDHTKVAALGICGGARVGETHQAVRG